MTDLDRQVVEFLSTRGVLQFSDIMNSLDPGGYDSERLLVVANRMEAMRKAGTIKVVRICTPHGDIYQGYELDVLHRLAAV
jgi:hypothetical protein